PAAPHDDPSAGESWLVRLDAGGNTLWATNYSTTFPTYNISSVQPSMSNLFLFCGTSPNDAGSVVGGMGEIRIPVGAPLLFIDQQPSASSNIFVTNAIGLSWVSSFTNSAIFYTLNGSKPGLTSSRFSSSVLLTNSATVRAIAFTSDFAASSEADPVSV